MLWRNLINPATNTSIHPNTSSFSNNSTQIFVATLDGIVKILDTRSGKILGECTGHTAGILDISQSIGGNVLISCSDDGDCRVFDIEKVLTSVEGDVK